MQSLYAAALNATFEDCYRICAMGIASQAARNALRVFYQLYTMAHSILHTQCCRHGAEQQHFIRENRKALQPLRRHALLHTANLQRFGLLTK